MTNEPTLDEDLELATRLALLGSEIALHYFARGVSEETKPDGTPVTVADRAIEQALLAELARFRPEDAVLGEEHGARGTSSRRWLLDPIDGTFSFLRGESQWGTHVALEVADRIVLGVITRPVQGLRWWARRGGGAYRSRMTPGSSRVKLQVSAQAALCDSRVTVWTNTATPIVETLRARAKWIEPELDAILHLADGHMDAVIDPHGKAWDHAPLVILVEEAGGAFSDAHGGRRLDLGEGRFSNGLIHAELDALLANVPA
jgi:histidinol-phosphatase